MSTSHTTDTPATEFNPMQKVKRRFFAMRNGALAAQMRQRGLNYSINFGLNIPQIKETADMVMAGNPSSAQLLELANELWANKSTRESRLLAPMLFPSDIMSEELALDWLTDAQTTEVADHLCHSLLRRLPFAYSVACSLLNSPEAGEMQIYSAMRLIMNLLAIGRIGAREAAGAVKNFSTDTPALWRPVLIQILDEITFLNEE